MDNFLYIIIGIVWLAYSFYSNNQKKQRMKAEQEARKSGQPVVPPPARTRTLLEELLDPQPPVVVPPAEAEEEWVQPEVFFPVDARSAEVIQPEAQSLERIVEEVSESYFEQQYAERNRKKDDIRVIQPEEVAPVNIVEYIVDDDFDLRRAVIFSEILNPRYF